MALSNPVESIPVIDSKSKAAKKKKQVATDSGFVQLNLDTTLYTYPSIDTANAHASLNIKRIGVSKMRVASQVFSKKFVLDWYERTVSKQEAVVTSSNGLKRKSPLVNYKRVFPLSLLFLFLFFYV